MSKPSNLVLIGLMGSGKSTVGRMVAQKLGLDFVDLDEYLEAKAGRTISSIFDELGEPYFRELEGRIVQEVSSWEKKVVSCGGGVVEREANMLALKKKGLVTYLSTSLDELYSRLIQSHDRPLLKVANPRKRLEEIYQRRRPLYEKYADLVVETERKSPYVVAEEMLEKLKGAGFERQ